MLTLFRPSDSDEELRNSAAGIASRLEMQEILQHSNSALRRQEETLDNNRRLQTTFARAAALSEPFPRGTDRTPPPPAYDPMQGGDSTPIRPNAPISPGEAARDRVELPAAPGRVVIASRTDGDCYTSIPEPEQVHVYSDPKDSSVGRSSE